MTLNARISTSEGGRPAVTQERIRNASKANGSPPQAPAGGAWNAEAYNAHFSFVWEFATDLLSVLAPKQGERVLDVGCGTGQLTSAIAEAGADVTGIDNDEAMVSLARQNFPGVAFEVVDARKMTYESDFDTVFSNASLHWMRPPTPVVAGISRALKPGGRLVAEMGGKGNVASTVAIIRKCIADAGYGKPVPRSPWYFPDIPTYTGLLKQHGLNTTMATLFARPTPLTGGPEGMARWLDMFAGSFFERVPAHAQPGIVDAIVEELQPWLYHDGQWVADYVRLRVIATKPL